VKPRHVPQRTCIGCRQEQGKRTLVRVVRSPDGHVRIDSTMRANGRGAYLHANRLCWEKALKGATMNHALRTTTAKEDIEALRAFAQALPDDEEGEQV
jgi:uncharacterized protein